MHVHAVEPYVMQLAENRNVGTGFGVRPRAPFGTGPNDRLMGDPEAQIAYMDEAGIDIHVVSLPGVISGTGWAAAPTDLALCRLVNDCIAGWVRAHPSRFVGSCVLPLQDPHLALGELHRCVAELGLRIANLPANINGVYLGEPSFRPLWQALRALEMVAWVHPDGVKDAWFQRYSMWNSVGQSVEEARVMASLIYDGILDRYPEVPIVIAHGGGYFPHYMGRLDRNVTNMPASIANISRRPSDYLRDFYYDTCVYDPAVLRVLAERVGPERLLMGSDFPVNRSHPVEFLREAAVFSETDLALVAGGNAARLLQLC